MNSTALWYLTRGTGVVSLILLTLSVALGVANVRRARTEAIPRFVVDAVHRTASLLAISFLLVHIATALIDKFAPIRLLDAIVPFRAAYRPLWLGLGALAFDLLLAVALTSLARRRLGYRTWRATHWAAYASWPVALLHGLGTGSDARTTWMLTITACCVIVVIVAVVARATAGWPEHIGARSTAIAASALVPLGLLVWLPSGPLAAGWAKRAGTPNSLLVATGGGSSNSGSSNSGSSSGGSSSGGSSSGVSSSGGSSGGGGSGSSSSAAGPGGAPQFSTQANGAVSQEQLSGSLNQVRISLTLAGQRLSRLNLRLDGQPLAGGGVAMTSSRVTLGTSSDHERYTGRITALEGSTIQARLSDSGGSTITLTAQLQIQPGSGQATGTVAVQPG